MVRFEEGGAGMDGLEVDSGEEDERMLRVAPWNRMERRFVNG